MTSKLPNLWLKFFNQALRQFLSDTRPESTYSGKPRHAAGDAASAADEAIELFCKRFPDTPDLPEGEWL